MMKRVLGSLAMVALLAAVALPFARESWQRYEVNRQLSGLFDATDRAAFAGWDGSASAFVASLRNRCLRVRGDPGECERYRLASE